MSVEKRDVAIGVTQIGSVIGQIGLGKEAIDTAQQALQTAGEASQRILQSGLALADLLKACMDHVDIIESQIREVQKANDRTVDNVKNGQNITRQALEGSRSEALDMMQGNTDLMQLHTLLQIEKSNGGLSDMDNHVLSVRVGFAGIKRLLGLIQDVNQVQINSGEKASDFTAMLGEETDRIKTYLQGAT